MTTLQDILKATAKHFKVRAKDIRFRTRRKTICDARSVFCWLARRLTNQSLKEIREFLGGRHHSVIVVAAQRARQIPYLRAEAIDIAMSLKVNKKSDCKCPRCGCVIRRDVA